jgi:hypothetical protein
MKWILLSVLALVLWYILAPLITPRSLRPPKPPAGAGPDEKAPGDNRRSSE